MISLDRRDIEKFIKAFPEDEYYCPPEDILHHWAMVHKRSFEVEGETLWVAPPEYVILRKLEFYREGGSDKHLRDIAGMMANSSEVIDFSFLSDQMKLLGLEREWEKAKGFSNF